MQAFTLSLNLFRSAARSLHGSGSRRMRADASKTFCGALLLPLLLLGVLPAAHATLTGGSVRTGTSIAPTGDGLCALDPSITDMNVCTHGQVTYALEFVGDGGDDPVTITSQLPVGATWEALPPSCSGAGSGISADRRTLTCVYPGPVAPGTVRILPTARISGELPNGAQLSAPITRYSSPQNAAPVVATDLSGALTVKARPAYDLIKVAHSSPFQSYPGPNGEAGYLLHYSIQISVPNGQLQGMEALTQALTITDTVPAQASLITWGPAAAYTCHANSSDVPAYKTGQTNFPGGIGGTCTATQSAAGAPATLSLSGMNLTGGMQGYAFFVADFNLLMWLPASSLSEGENVLTNTIDWQARGVSGQPNVDPDPRNQVVTETLFVGDQDVQRGNLFKYFNVAPYDGSARLPADAGGNLAIITENATQAAQEKTICEKIDNTRYRVNAAAKVNVPGAVIEYGSGGVGGAGQAWASENDQRIATCADDQSSVWYADPATVPGGMAAITKIRARFTAPPGTSVFQASYTVLGRYAFNGYATNHGAAAAGQPIPVGERMINWTALQVAGAVAATYDQGDDQAVQDSAGQWWGISRNPDPLSSAYGDTLYVARAIAAVSKRLVPANAPTTVLAGNVVTFRLQPSLDTMTGIAGSTPTTVVLRDVLPAALVYQAGSATAGEPQVQANTPATGYTTLTWTLDDVLPGTAIPAIDYQVRIDAFAPNSRILPNFVEISTALDPEVCPASTGVYAGMLGNATINADTGAVGGTLCARAARQDIMVSNPGGLQLRKTSDTPVILVNGTLQYTLTWGGIQSPVDRTDLIDVLPYNGDARTPATHYRGGVAGSANLHLENLIGPVANDGAPASTIYYTRATAASIVQDPGDPSNALAGGSTRWCTSAEFGSAGCPANKDEVTAFRVVSPSALAESSMRSVSVVLRTGGNEAGDVYTNAFTIRGIVDGQPLVALLSSNAVSSATQEPPVTVSKVLASGGPTATAGTTLGYTLTLRNNGANAVANHAFYESIPAYTTYQSVTGATVSGCAAGDAGRRTCTLTVANVPANGTATVTLMLRVAERLPAGLSQLYNLVTDTVCDPSAATCVPPPACDPAADANQCTTPPPNCDVANDAEHCVATPVQVSPAVNFCAVDTVYNLAASGNNSTFQQYLLGSGASVPGPVPDLLNSGASPNALMIDPVRNRMLVVAQGNLYAYDPANGGWYVAAGSAPDVPRGGFTRDGTGYLVGGGASPLVYRVTANGSFGYTITNLGRFNYDPPGNYNSGDIAFDADGMGWMFAGSYLFRFDPATRVATRHLQPLLDGAVVTDIPSIAFGSDGQAYVSRAGQMYTIDLGTGVMRAVGTSSVSRDMASCAFPALDTQLSVAKTLLDEDGALPGLAEAGETLTYQIRLRNTGNLARTLLPGDVIETVPVATTAASGDSFDCAAGAAAGTACHNRVAVTVPAAIGGTAGEALLSFKVTVVDPIPAGTDNIANHVVVADLDCTLADNDCEETTPTAPQVTVRKALTGESGSRTGIAEAGEVLTYTLTLSNRGGTEARDHAFYEVLPANTTLNAIGGTGVGANCAAGDAGARLCTITVAGPIAANGGTATATVVVRVDDPLAAGVSRIVNLITDDTRVPPVGCDPASQVCTTPPSCDPAADANHCVVTPVQEPRISVSKALTSGGPTAEAGETLVYTIELHNNSGTSAREHAFYESIPAHTRFQSVSGASVSGCAAGDAGRRTCTLTVAEVPGNGSATVTLSVRVADQLPTGLGSLYNLVTDGVCDPTDAACAPPPACDPATDAGQCLVPPPTCDVANDPDHCVATPVARPQVTVKKALTGESGTRAGIAENAETLTYTLTLTNDGNAAAGNHAFYERLPEYTKLVSIGGPGVSHNCAAGDAGPRLCTITVVGPVAAAGGTAQVSVVLITDPVLPADVRQIYNLVTDDTGTTPPRCDPATQICAPPPVCNPQTDPNQCNQPPPSCDPNVDPEHCVATPVAPASVTVRKQLTGEDGAATGLAEPGETLTYTLTLTNEGGQSAPDHAFFEQLPAHVTLVGISGPGVSSNCAPGDIGSRLCQIAVAGPIAGAGGTATVTVVVKVADALPAGTATLVNLVTDDTSTPPPGCDPATQLCGGGPQLPPQCDATADPLHCVSTPVAALLSVDKEAVGVPQAVQGSGDEFVVRYTVTVSNSGGSAGRYDLIDTPQFDANASIVSAQATRGQEAPIVLQGAGPWVLAQDRELAVGAREVVTVEIRVRVAIAGNQDNATCVAATPGKGLFNLATLTVGGRELRDDACVTTPTPQTDTVLVVEKRGSVRTAEIGDLVSYSIRVRNNGNGVAVSPVLVDRLPAGFRLVDGSARVTGATLVALDGAPGPVLRLSLDRIDPGAEVLIAYRVRIGVGALEGDGINRAQVECRAGAATQPCSNEDRWEVDIDAGVFAEEGCIAGQVFVDCNYNSVKDGEELGIPGVRLYLQDGTFLVSDSEGKYSYCGLRPTTHVIKVDSTTLPTRSRLVTSSSRNAGDANSVFVDMKKGELHRADFIEGSCNNEVIEQVKARKAQGEVSSVQTEPGQPALRFESKPVPQAHPLQQGTDGADQPLERTRHGQPPAAGGQGD